MGRCRKCGKKGLFFKVNSAGLCGECEQIYGEKKKTQKTQKNDGANNFDIMNADTWDYASQDKPFVWKGEQTFWATDVGNERDLTEKEILNLVIKIIHAADAALSKADISLWQHLNTPEVITQIMGNF
jgi:hypothetical protein